MPADRFSHPKERQHEGISKLKDFEFRVWDQYKLSADDFGVMERVPWRLKADNPALACRSDKSLIKALERLVKLGILRSFTAGPRTFLYQHDWQTFQKIDYPRPTVDPKPPAELLAECDDVTRLLFDKHPGGKGRKKESRSETVRETVSEPLEKSATTRAQPREEAKANGIRLEASSLSEGGAGETALAPVKSIGARDVWFRQLYNTYPVNRRQSGQRIEVLFNDVFTKDARPDESIWSDMMLSLQSAKEGYEWRVKGMVPKMENWLSDGNCFQRHERAPVATVVSEKTARNLTAMEEFIKAGER